MGKLLLLLSIFFFLAPKGLFSQQDVSLRKGQFRFNLGPEYRITPIYSVNNSSPSDEAIFTNVDKQNSGIALNIGVEYFITKNFSLGFSNTFRYDLVISEFTEIENDFGVRKADYKVLFDYHLYLSYYFKIFQKGEIFINAGVSLMNRNTDFSIKETSSDGVIESFFFSDYHYSSNRLSVGYSNNGNSLFVGTYLTQQTPFFNQNVLFAVPFVGLRFDIAKL